MRKIIKHWREWLIVIISLCALVVAFSLSPIPQDTKYHNFADVTTLLGIPNFWNVVSNVPFVLAGIFGLIKFFRKETAFPGASYLLFCTGVFLVGAGSAYYHYDPTSQSLVWDRLPMTVAFMALFSMVVSDRISVKLGARILWPLLLAGIASVGYWYWSELQGRGDLRAYAVIQFLPMILIPVILIVYREKVMKSSFLWGTLGTYALAHVAEHYDLLIYSIGGITSGHTIKHLLAALAVLWVIMSFPKISHSNTAIYKSYPEHQTEA
jgi:hypothetical protein